MTLLIIFLIIVVWLILIIRSPISLRGRGRSRRGTYRPDQNLHAPTPPPDIGLLNNSTQNTPNSYGGNASYGDTSSSIYFTDLSAAGVGSDADTGSVDYGGGGDYGSSVDAGGGSDFGGFGGGGDFGGGGSGGGWGDSSS